MLAALSPIERIRVLTFIFIIVFVYVCEASIIIRFLHRRFVSKAMVQDGKFLKWFKRCIHALAVIGVLTFVWGWFFEPYMLEVNTVTIETDKLTRASFRIVQISDLHCDAAERNETEVVRIVNSLNPDVVIFTGDAINEYEALPLLKRALSEIRAPLGKFAVRGNFDAAAQRAPGLFENTGFDLLELENVYIEKGGEKIAITGAGFGQDPACVRCMTLEAEPGLFHVFLSHAPDFAEDLENAGADLYLCGHTHGGQVRLPFLGAIMTISKFGKKYEAGRYDIKGMILYVNRGIGMEPFPAPQVRFLCRPEIAVFYVVPKR
jgi:hypothetical protein